MEVHDENSYDIHITEIAGNNMISNYILDKNDKNFNPKDDIFKLKAYVEGKIDEQTNNIYKLIQDRGIDNDDTYLNNLSYLNELLSLRDHIKQQALITTK